MAGFSDSPLTQSIAVPSVCLLISFLAYFSQYTFYYSTTLEPGPPSQNETIIFNVLLTILWYTYFKVVTVDPGRYVFPEKVIEVDDSKRWCRKCEAPKPPRAHHCRHCNRCIPKMDHHCPWTRNCVSMTTFPHFLRFIVYTNLSLWMLGYLIGQRFYALWEARDLPSYLGPSLRALVALALLSLVGLFTSLALGIMLVNTVKCWIFNQTMIEGWEVDRHEAIVEKGGREWWDIKGPDGEKIRFERVEFPYDIGFYSNMAQAMGTSNPLCWFNPFAGHPRINKTGTGSGWEWEENGFNRKEGMWPPPDPEKIRRAARAWPAARRDYEAELRDLDKSPDEMKRAFKERQEADFKRRKNLLAELEEVNQFDDIEDDDDDSSENEDSENDGPAVPQRPTHSTGIAAPSHWTNSDGERLHDYGVDEDSEEGVDDDIPLAEIVRRRKAAGRADGQDL